MTKGYGNGEVGTIIDGVIYRGPYVTIITLEQLAKELKGTEFLRAVRHAIFLGRVKIIGKI